MQGHAPVTDAEFLAPVQNCLLRLEVWDGAVWRNLSSLGGRSYLKGIEMSLGGAKQSTTPTAGAWSATIDNPLGIFHPKHPSSSWATLLQTGREIRISVGAIYGGVARYYQRMAGFMEAPSFDHGAHEVHISGQDYMQLLTNTILGEQDPITESGSGSGSTRVDDVINGPLHWGGRSTFNSKATGGAGSELYDEADACEIGAHEANNVASWAVGGSGGAVSSQAGVESNFLLRLARDMDWTDVGDQYAENTNVASLTAGQQYIVQFWGRTVDNASWSDGYGRFTIRQGTTTLASTTFAGDGGLTTVIFTAAATAAMAVRLYSSGKYAMAGDFVEIDNISIKTYDPDTWWQYDLPPDCNGPYLLTLNGDPIGMGYQDEETSWHYDAQANSVHFGEQATIENGSDNLHVYYYKTQALENILADLLVYCGLYATRATALADMDYTPTGITVPRAWFDPNSTALAAVAKICERANYRFWFAYDGKPCFQPAPTADSIDWTFPSWGDLTAYSDYQDDTLIRNPVTIEGAEQSLYQLNRDDKASDRWKATASAALGAGQLPHPYTMQNHLFQSQAACTIMAAALLADSKDPKWYADLSTHANPVPLEIGDTIAFPIQLEPPAEEGSTSGVLEISAIGIIRDIKISNFQISYKLELVDDLWSAPSVASSSAGPEPASSAAPSASTPPPESETPSASLPPESASPQSPLSYVLDAADSGATITVQAGYTQAIIECWGPGGKGFGAGAPVLHGGGGGGGAYSLKTLAVSAGQQLVVTIPTGAAPDDCYVTRSGVTVCLAAKGNDGIQSAGGAGGSALSCVGDTRRGGGNGYYTAGGLVGGGGGSSAGTGANGNNAVGQNGAAAPAEGGNGGNGGARYNDGFAGETPGGGGGGCGDDGEADRLGGDGGDGQIHIVLT